MELTVVGSLEAFSSAGSGLWNAMTTSSAELSTQRQVGQTSRRRSGKQRDLLSFLLSPLTILVFMMSQIFATAVSIEVWKSLSQFNPNSQNRILLISDPDPARCCIVVDHRIFFMFVWRIKCPFYEINSGNHFQAMGWVSFPCSTAWIMLVRRSFALNSVGICSPDTTRKSNARLTYKLFLLLFFSPPSPLWFLFQTLSLSVMSTRVPVAWGAPKRVRLVSMRSKDTRWRKITIRLFLM